MDDNTDDIPFGEFPKNTDKPSDNDEPLTQESLQLQLANYRKALEQEFDLEARPELIDADVLAESIKKQMIQKLPIGFKTLAYLAEHAESESVRLHSAKFIIEAAIGKNALAPISDPMQGLLSKLAHDEKS